MQAEVRMQDKKQLTLFMAELITPSDDPVTDDGDSRSGAFWGALKLSPGISPDAPCAALSVAHEAGVEYDL